MQKTHADEDKKLKEEIDIKNSADALIFSTEKQLAELGDKIPADKRPAIDGALEKLKDAHKNGTIETITTGMEELSKVWSEVAADLLQRRTAGLTPERRKTRPERRTERAVTVQLKMPSTRLFDGDDKK